MTNQGERRERPGICFDGFADKRRVTPMRREDGVGGKTCSWPLGKGT